MPGDLHRESIERIVDEEHLKLLSLGYMVSAGMTVFSSLMGLWFVVMGGFMGLAFSAAKKSSTKMGQQPPPFFGWIFACIGAVIFIVLLVMAGLKLRAAFCLKNRKSRTFCMAVAGITCIGFPYGTLLGVLSFLVLGRDSVARLFASAVVSPPPA